MMVHARGVLGAEQLAAVTAGLEAACWVDGRRTAGPQSAQVKRNEQLDDGSEVARAMGQIVVAALERHPVFLSAALPRRILPPLFNRYGDGMGFGAHIDNAMRLIPGTPQRLRTDLSATIFLSDPAGYDGGELVVQDVYGEHSAKLPAGDMVLYPASSVHRVETVTRGVRVASVFWVQSLVRDDAERALLYDLDNAIRQMRADAPHAQALVTLTGVYHNLVRRWSEV